MHAKIGINAAPQAVMNWLSRPENTRHWFAHLRHAAEEMPDVGLSADAGAMLVRWTAAPAGEMHVTGRGHASDLTLTFSDTGHVVEPPVEEMSPDDPQTNAGNALRSVKSHVENAEGGDPDMHTRGVVSKEEVEEMNRDKDPAAT
ncbi:hypothetical protein ACE7GA_15445 [Roseomonas sp. CCTCC AB2023176]|uniref:hypothetical protein n=1 Tax=Roseomonas sp. CCTCC AB2023176 TaxID=3342640 RepID=UPI0035E19EE2